MKGPGEMPAEHTFLKAAEMQKNKDTTSVAANEVSVVVVDVFLQRKSWPSAFPEMFLCLI